MSISKNIAILSGKGGTGKTTLAINLAAALHNMGEDVLLVDANLENPHVGVSLGSGLHLNTLHDVLSDRIAHTQAVHYHDSGLKVVPGDLRPKSYPLKHERLAKYRQSADVVLYDCPPNNHAHVWHAADQALIITQAQFPALADAARIINEVRAENKVLAGVVLNKPGKHDLSLEEVESYLGVPVISKLPLDHRFDEALRHREPYFFANERRPAGQALKELGARLV